MLESLATSIRDAVSGGVCWLGYSGVQPPSSAVADSYHLEERRYSHASTISAACCLDALLKLVEMEEEVPGFITLMGSYLLELKRD